MKQAVSSNETGAGTASGQYKTAVLHRALDILEVVAFARRSLTLQDVAERTALPRATAFRLLANLVERGYVHRSAAGTFSLGSRAGLLGALPQGKAHLRDIALPRMRQIRDHHGHTVSLALRIAHQLLYLETVEGTQALRFVEPVGATGPLHATALGKSLLAWAEPSTRSTILAKLDYERFTDSTIRSAKAFRDELERVRERGYAVDDEESVAGARCVSAPILDATGIPIAAMSVSAPLAALDTSAAALVAAELQRACSEIADLIKEDASME